MSLDEITILHENLFWREIRVASVQLGDPWKYVTQWQILFAPAILLVLAYLIVFFTNRFRISPQARRRAFAGIGCWLSALLLEALRGSFKQSGEAWYSLAVLSEEVLEISGGILLLASVVSYTIDIALDLTSERKLHLQQASRFLTWQALTGLGLIFVFLTLSAGAVYLSALSQASEGAPTPRLVRKALEAQKETRTSGPTEAVPSSNTSQFEVWFGELADAPDIPEPTAKKLVRYAAEVAFGESGQTTPTTLEEDRFPRIVFLSLSDGKSPAQVLMGAGKGVSQALENALSKIEKVRIPVSQRRWLKLDIARDVQIFPSVKTSIPLPLDRTLHGIAFDTAFGIALLPGEVLANRLVSREGELQVDRIARYVRRQSADNKLLPILEASEVLKLYRFQTTSYFAEGENVLSLYRGHRLVDAVSRDDVMSAARRGGEYLVRSVGSNGKFVYRYWPKTDKVRPGYNILRHAGTIYAMLELYKVTGEEELLSAARRALGYLISSARPSLKRDTGSLCIVEEGFVKLGGNALGAVALAKYAEVTGDNRFRSTMIALTHWIRNSQEETGEFRPHKMAYPSGEASDFVSQYYPGEALLALLRVHALQPSDPWLDAAEKGARYLIEVRDRDLPISRLAHDHWLLYALNELYRLRPDPLYLEHARRITNAILRHQNRRPQYRDWLGSYYRPPRSTPTATRTEGLAAVYRLERDFGDPEKAERILAAIRLGLRFQLQTQFQPESVLYLRDPQRSLGAFHRSLSSFEIRIDYVQHNISSLLSLWHILGGKE